jgi:hypothetical protein
MDAAVIPTADAIKTAHCGETADKMLLKDCMVTKTQIGVLREQNISSTEDLTGYVSRAPVASARTTRCVKSESHSAFLCSFSSYCWQRAVSSGGGSEESCQHACQVVESQTSIAGRRVTTVKITLNTSNAEMQQGSSLSAHKPQALAPSAPGNCSGMSVSNLANVGSA